MKKLNQLDRDVIMVIASVIIFLGGILPVFAFGTTPIKSRTSDITESIRISEEVIQISESEESNTQESNAQESDTNEYLTTEIIEDNDTQVPTLDYGEDVTDIMQESEETTLNNYYLYDNIDAIYMAKTVNVEAPYCSTMEQAAVMWCILNRVDDGRFGNSIVDVVTSPNQFGYFEFTILREDLYVLALDVLNRWYLEKQGVEDVGRVLAKEYLYFWGDGQHNHFRINNTDQWYWDWSLQNPYEVN